MKTAGLQADAQGVEPTALASRWRVRDERGSTLIEFALLATLLVTLLLGIVVFGILLGKRQVLTQATAEGARAAVPFQYTPADTSNLKAAARNQVNKSLEAVNRVCDDGRTDCNFVVYSCAGTTSTPPAGSGDCLEVSVTLWVKRGADPLAPAATPISLFLPATMSSKFTATLSNPT